MFYLILAILSSALVSITMRLSEKHVKNEMVMFVSNYAICVFFSFLFANSFHGIKMSMPTIGLGILSGFLYLASFVYLKMNMKYNGIVMASTFMKLGVLIPTLMAIVIFKEIPSFTQIIGIILSLFAITMIHYEKDSLQETSKKSWLLLLLLLSGITDSMANIFDKVGNGDEKDLYLFITFLFAFFFALAVAFIKKEEINLKDLLYGALIGIPNYFSARFLLLALGNMEAILVYPMYSVMTIIAISSVGILCFHEKISTKKKWALCIILCAVCLLNL